MKSDWSCKSHRRELGHKKRWHFDEQPAARCAVVAKPTSEKKTKKKTNRNRRCRLISRPSSPPKKQTNKQTNKQKTKRPSTIPSSRTRRIDGDLVGASIGCRRISVVVIGCRRSTESDAGERETPFRVADHRLRQRCRFARRRGNSVRPGTSSSFPDHIFSFSQ